MRRWMGPLSFALVAAIVVARLMDVPIPDACHGLTPDDWFWWWFYGCGEPAAGGGGGGAGFLLLLPSWVRTLTAPAIGTKEGAA